MIKYKKYFNNSEIIPISVDKISDIIMDIAKYPDFLPFCHKIVVVDVRGDGVIIADTTLKLAFITTTYRCEIVPKLETPLPQLLNLQALEAAFALSEVKFMENENNYKKLKNLKYPVDYSEINIKSVYSDIFHPLNSRWRLIALSDGSTLVNFMLEFRLHSALYQQAAELIFPKLCAETMQAFRMRALGAVSNDG